MKTKSHVKKKVNLITLGCSKNLVDSENIITQLRHGDWNAEHEQQENAEVVIINTCGFIETAKQESVDTIIQFAQAKTEGEIENLYVTGCLSQRYRKQLAEEIPEVDAWFGTLELPELLSKFNIDYKHELIGERQTSTPNHFAYLKIAEGCSRTCSFCAIPMMRGSHISRTIESLVKEAENLASYGVKELMLISQELTYYGLDIYKKRALADLIRALDRVEGIEWIRLHYAYPGRFPLDVFDAMAEATNVCKYLDIPLQHVSDNVLKRMKRHTKKKDVYNVINAAREQVPGIAIRTTFLVGFPGETEADFEELLDFIREMKFERVGVFQYSHEEGTSAHLLVDDVPAEVKVDRANRLMEVQRAISQEKNSALVGKTLKVLFDRKEGAYFVGRTEYDSPEVDNEVLVLAEKNFVRIGDFANILISDATEFDLFGDVVAT